MVQVVVANGISPYNANSDSTIYFFFKINSIVINVFLKSTLTKREVYNIVLKLLGTCYPQQDSKGLIFPKAIMWTNLR